MKRSTVVVMIGLLLAASTAFAHGDMEHVLGTVTGTTDHSITVKTRTGATTEVAVDSATEFLRGDAHVSLPDVHPGDRVVIHARNHDGKLQAAKVQLGTPKASTPPPSH